jgi:hypothetical protein
MADQVLSNIASALSVQFQPKMDRQFNRLSVLASVLQTKPGAGQNLTWDVRFSRSTQPANFTEGSDVSAGEFQTDPTVPASLSWGQYRTGFSISGLALTAARSSANSPEALMQLFEGNLEDAASALISKINGDLFTGAGTGTLIAGLYGSGALATTGTYANVARGTYAEWASNVLANGAVPRALTKALLDQLEEQIFNDCSMPPDLIVGSPGVIRKYESLFDSVIRTAPAGAPANSGELSVIQKLQMNSGYTGLTYKGIPVLRDRNATAGKLAMLNSQMVEIATLAQDPVTSASSKTDRSAGNGGEPPAPSGIQVRVEPLAKTGDANKFQLVTYVQLKVRRPNACGVVEDIDES